MVTKSKILRNLKKDVRELGVDYGYAHCPDSKRYLYFRRFLAVYGERCIFYFQFLGVLHFKEEN